MRSVCLSGALALLLRGPASAFGSTDLSPRYAPDPSDYEAEAAPFSLYSDYKEEGSIADSDEMEEYDAEALRHLDEIEERHLPNDEEDGSEGEAEAAGEGVSGPGFRELAPKMRGEAKYSRVYAARKSAASRAGFLSPRSEPRKKPQKGLSRSGRPTGRKLRGSAFTEERAVRPEEELSEEEEFSELDAAYTRFLEGLDSEISEKRESSAHLDARALEKGEQIFDLNDAEFPLPALPNLKGKILSRVAKKGGTNFVKCGTTGAEQWKQDWTHAATVETPASDSTIPPSEAETPPSTLGRLARAFSFFVPGGRV